MLKNTVELIKTVVADFKLALARVFLVNFHLRTQSIAKLAFQRCNVGVLAAASRALAALAAAISPTTPLTHQIFSCPYRK